MDLKIIHIINIAALVQILFLAFFLIKKKKTSTNSNFILAALFIILSIFIYSIIIIGTNSFEYFRYAFLGDQFTFITGPLLFFYIKTLITGKKIIFNIIITHLIPFFAAAIYIISKFFINLIITYSTIDLAVLNILAFCINIAYLLKIINLIKNYEVSKKNIKTLKILIAGFYLILTIQIILKTVFNIFAWDILIWSRRYYFDWVSDILNIYFIAIFLFIYLLTFLFLSNPNSFHTKNKYKTSRLDDSKKNNYKKLILEFLTKEKPFLNPKLSLKDLAEQLKISDKILSQIINDVFKKNFYDFINSFRIKESLILLKDIKNKKTILEILFAVGFNSKSTFNSAFKKTTGLTPKEYRKSLSKKISKKSINRSIRSILT